MEELGIWLGPPLTIVKKNDHTAALGYSADPRLTSMCKYSCWGIFTKSVELGINGQ